MTVPWSLLHLTPESVLERVLGDPGPMRDFGLEVTTVGSRTRTRLTVLAN